MPANTSSLLGALDKKRQDAQKEFSQKHGFAQQWLSEKGLQLSQIRQHSARLLTGVVLGSAFLLVSPQLADIKLLPEHKVVISKDQAARQLRELFSQPTTPKSEADISALISEAYQVPVAFELAGNRLPTYTGKMGLEQHLIRYPGDGLGNHDALVETGMAPLRGAFGYFAREGVSQEQMALEEKYYIVLQTFVIPEWNSDWHQLKPWYAFRKFLVINPETGQAVVAVLGDAGPATWTGKVFGGSPETMLDLGFYPKRTKGEVVVLFIDDPENTIPLGPVNVQ